MNYIMVSLIFISSFYQINCAENFSELRTPAFSCKKVLLKCCLALVLLLNAAGTGSDLWAIQENLNRNTSAVAVVPENNFFHKNDSCATHQSEPITNFYTQLKIPACRSSYFQNESLLWPNLVSLSSRVLLFLPLLILTCFSCNWWR